MKKFLNKETLVRILENEHNGVGGLYFIFTTIICAFITVMVLELSWTSQAVAMADNIAYIVSINTTVHSYTGNVAPFERDFTNESTISTENKGNYNPLNDFNNMIKEAGLSKEGSKICSIKWTGKGTYIQFGEFETSLGIKVRPHEQQSIIEDY